jgi:uncharacterized protein YlbG (UPF0298 family)
MKMSKNNNTEIIQPTPEDLQKAVKRQAVILADQNEDKNIVKYLIDTVDDFREQQYDQVVSKGYAYDPRNPAAFSGLYRRRDTLLPYFVIKQLAEADDLLAVIVQTRANQLQHFGHIQVDRHKIGYKIAYRNKEEIQKLTLEQRAVLDKRVQYVRDLFYHCGFTDSLKEQDKKTLPQFLKEVARAALLAGFAPVEIRYKESGEFHSFHSLDFGTIYKAPVVLPFDQAAKNSLQQSLTDLQKVRDQHPIDFRRMNFDKFCAGEYTTVQVINTIPLTAFTDKELIFHNFYPDNEIQWNGYPFGPLEAVVRDVTSHLNANTHNSNYWKNGRASRGFLTVTSDDVTEVELQRIRTQFNASINSVANAFRMPLFAVGKEDAVTFQAFDNGTRDQEFIYLSDNLSRVILSSFGMDPAELPGMSQLTRPTFSQALSESSNEFNLQAARSAGFIPLLMDTESLMNKIFKIMDPQLAEICIFKFVGLESDDSQKESIRLQQDMNIHLTANEINQVVEKKPLPLGGNIPLNPQWLNAVKEHVSEGMFRYAFMGDKNALTDPTLAFSPSGFWFQWISLYPELLRSKGRVSATLEEYARQIKEIMVKK